MSRLGGGTGTSGKRSYRCRERPGVPRIDGSDWQHAGNRGQLNTSGNVWRREKHKTCPDTDDCHVDGQRPRACIHEPGC